MSVQEAYQLAFGRWAKPIGWFMLIGLLFYAFGQISGDGMPAFIGGPWILAGLAIMARVHLYRWRAGQRRRW